MTHFDGVPGHERALSNSSTAPFRFLSFLTKLSTAFSAHFSSSSPCFQPSSFLTAGLVNENRLLRLDIGPLLEDSPSSVSIPTSCYESPAKGTRVPTVTAATDTPSISNSVFPTVSRANYELHKIGVTIAKRPAHYDLRPPISITCLHIHQERGFFFNSMTVQQKFLR